MSSRDVISLSRLEQPTGKTLCYNLPVLSGLLHEKDAEYALYLFPTKALAQDKLATLHTILGQTEFAHQLKSIQAAIYDGGMSDQLPCKYPFACPPVDQQSRYAAYGNFGITPIGCAFSGLTYVVIDEMHTYRGVFGSHVANVIRRLKRVAHFYGASPLFILTTATIDNPIDLAQRLIEEQVHLIDHDGEPKVQNIF